MHLLHAHAGHLRAGVGRALLHAALATLPGPAELKCATDNNLALAFYARPGWVKTERKAGGLEPFVRLRSRASSRRGPREAALHPGQPPARVP